MPNSISYKGNAKTTIRYNFTFTINNNNKEHNKKCWKGYGTFIHSWWEFKMVQPLYKIIWQLLSWAKHIINTSPSNPQKACTQIFIVTVSIIVKDGNNSKPINDEWIYKCGMSIHWNIIQILKKNKVLITFCGTNELWKHYVKWKELVMKDYIRFHLHEMSRRDKSI